jgi:hypothetical protein
VMYNGVAAELCMSQIMHGYVLCTDRTQLRTVNNSASLSLV